MARKKGTNAEEESRKISDGRFNNPLNKKIQEQKLNKACKKLRGE
jgi:hypothetical protein